MEATELKLPNWPYLLAVQVNAALESQRAKSTAKELRKTPEPPPVSASLIPPGTLTPDRFATYLPKDLLAMKQLPTGGIFKGSITKLNRQVAGGDLDVVLVLDGVLQCEVNLNLEMSQPKYPTNIPYYPWYYYGSSTVRHSSTLELVESENSIKLVQKNRATTQYSGSSYSNYYYSRPRSGSATSSTDLLTLRVGQTILVEGVIVTKVGKKPFVRGVVKPEK